ncbi:hypothetical protein QE152_g24354 [Popillia japonica]|uniref:Uncharacterized protein n=1 Tax=Popillia japonica TaxID=7064 RepID=A0AAW1KFD0_POPJA
MWSDKILSLSTEDLSLWKISRNLKKKSIGSVLRTLHGPGGVIYVHAEHLAGVFGGNPSGDAAIDEFVADLVGILPGLEGRTVRPTNCEEARAQINARKNKKPLMRMESLTKL